MKYDKLVRDKIPEYIRSKGVEPEYHIASEEEYWLKLKAKIREEADEFIEAESKEELADLIEVIEAVIDYKKYSREEIDLIRKKKVLERGAFKSKIILDNS